MITGIPDGMMEESSAANQAENNGNASSAQQLQRHTELDVTGAADGSDDQQ